MRIKLRLNLANIFFAAAVFFAFSSFFGLYERTIYDMGYFLLFWVMEILFWLGLNSGRLVFGRKRKKGTYSFYLSDFGNKLILVLNVLCVCSFIYFFYLYQKSVGLSFLSGHSGDKFEQEGRTALEKITLLIMQLGGDGAFLVTSCAKNYNKKWRRNLSTICLFLPGSRYLLMGGRYAIACEALIFLYVYRKEVQKKLVRGINAVKSKLLVIIAFGGLFVAFMILFKTRAIYYTALEKFEFYPGDIVLKPFWKYLYGLTGGGIDFLCSFSDYMAEAPYIFSYYCLYGMPSHPFGGILLFRPILKMFSAVSGNDIYSVFSSQYMTGKYAGAFYEIICDYGVYGGIIATYIFGLIFAKIERNSNRSRICAALLPAVAIMCFFAPVYYFNVGRLDYTVLFALVLVPVCLRKEYNG